MSDMPETAYFGYVGNSYIGVFDNLEDAIRILVENDIYAQCEYILIDVRTRKKINLNWRDYY